MNRLTLFHFFLASVLISLIACNPDHNHLDNASPLKQFSRASDSPIQRFELKYEKYELQDIDLVPLKMCIQNEWLCVVRDGSTDLVFALIKDGKVIHSFGQYGEGPGELFPTTIAKLYSAGDQIFAFDIVQQKLVSFNTLALDSSTQLPMPFFETKFNGVMVDEVFASNKFLIATSYAPSRNRFFKLDLDGQVTGEHGSFPTIEKSLDPRGLSEFFLAKGIANPKLDRFFIAYSYMDLVEIYDSNFALISQTRGPDNLPFEFRKVESETALRFSPIAGKTSRAFHKIVSYNEWIFGLYSGKPLYDESGESTPFIDHGEEIWVYDQEGTCQMQLALNIPIYDFDLHVQEKRMYAISDVEDTQVYTFDASALPIW